MNVKKMKMQLMATAASVLISGVALTSATYAWYVSNHTVEATTTQISATTNGFILQIATADQGPQHGGEQTSLAASTKGGRISPSSTDNLVDWYVCEGWNGEGKVTSYRTPIFTTKAEDPNVKPGQYGDIKDPHYAYLKSEYVLYTITETGLADVYLDASDNKYIDDGEEELKVVYAPYEETGKGNDAEAVNGWTCIGTGTDDKLKPVAVTYPYIYATTYADQNNQNWVATKVGKNYEVSSGTQKIASSVGYDGVKMRVYIWMEGTDADCVNNAAAEDQATYNVNVKLAGISAE